MPLRVLLLPVGHEGETDDLLTVPAVRSGASLISLTVIVSDSFTAKGSARPAVVPLSVTEKENAAGPPFASAAARNCIPWMSASV